MALGTFHRNSYNLRRRKEDRRKGPNGLASVFRNDPNLNPPDRRDGIPQEWKSRKHDKYLGIDTDDGKKIKYRTYMRLGLVALIGLGALTAFADENMYRPTVDPKIPNSEGINYHSPLKY